MAERINTGLNDIKITPQYTGILGCFFRYTSIFDYFYEESGIIFNGIPRGIQLETLVATKPVFSAKLSVGAGATIVNIWRRQYC